MRMGGIETPLLLTGFHRSGTSFVANVFHEGGLFLGEKLLGAKWSNPYGHFEDEEVVHFHDGILSDAMGSWYLPPAVSSVYSHGAMEWIAHYTMRRRALQRPYGFKDPRLCLTIRHWAAALPHLNVIYIHRDPNACIASIWKRAWGDYRHGSGSRVNKFLFSNPDFIAKIYLEYAASFLSFLQWSSAQRHNISVLHYEDVTSGRVDLFGVAARRFGLTLSGADRGSIYDQGAVTASDSIVEVDPVLADALGAFDRTFSALAEQDRLEQPRDMSVCQAFGATAAGQAALGLSSKRDAAAVALAAERQRLQGLQRVLRAKERALAAIHTELDEMQAAQNGQDTGGVT